MDAPRRGVCKRSRHPRQFTTPPPPPSFLLSPSPAEKLSRRARIATCHSYIYTSLPSFSQPIVRPSLSIYLSISGTNTTFVPMSFVRERDSFENLASEKASLSFRVRKASELTRERARQYTHTFTHKSSFFRSFSPHLSPFSLSLTQSLERSEPPT